jgi:tRNA-dihydrouridine synthase B
LGVQIWDNDPHVLARVGRCLAHQHRVSVIDLNFGCPVSRVARKAHSGSYLLSDPVRVGRIVERVVEACAPTPVTAKIRLGQDRWRITALEVARAVESAGAAALTVHGRTAAELFRGKADWQWIAAIKDHVARLPVIGNGDLQTPAQAAEAWRRYGLDGLMVGRALLHRPWLARQMAAAMQGLPVPPSPTADQERTAVLDHFERLLGQFGPEKGTLLMRKFACCYAQGRRGARLFRRQAAAARTPEQFRAIVLDYFPQDEAA